MTRLVKLGNNATSTLAASITSSATTATIAAGDGSKFPALTGSQYFMATLVKSDGTTEVVKVTARASDVLTIVRAAEAVGAGQASYAFSAGDRIEHRLTAGVLGSELDRLDAAALVRALNKSAPYSVTQADVAGLIRVSTASGAITVTLPQISTLTDDFDILVAKVTSDTNAVTIAASGADSINGSATYGISVQWQSAWLIADRSTNTWTAINSGAGGSNIVVDVFTGSGSAGPFALSGSPLTKNNTEVYVGGVYQQKSSYTLAGTSLTLGGVVASGISVEVIWGQPIAIGTPTDNTVSTAKVQDGAITPVKTFGLMPLAGGTFTGAVGFPSSGGAMSIAIGTGDGASYTVYNSKLHLHWGFGIEDYTGTINGYYDARNGIWDTKGGFKKNGADCTPLGVGQTLQNFTGSRALNTNYTNSTGRPIFVSVTGVQTANGARVIGLIVSSLFVDEDLTASASANDQVTVTGIVPAGAVYQVQASGINASPGWLELR